MSSRTPKVNQLPPPESRLMLTWQPHPANNCTVGVDLCQKMATDWATSLYQNVDPSALKNLVTLCKSWAPPPQSIVFDALRDYIAGVSTVINPLPHDTAKFFTSDVEALFSDWMTVRSDLENIWVTSSRMHDWLQEHVSNERHPEWEQSTSQTSRPTESIGASTGNYNSDS